jgi:hypothetical protein
MKFLPRLSAMLCLLLSTGLYSCSDDFKVAAPYKDISLVYGFLNRGDAVQYIRIQKAFLDENRSAIALAQIADSSFYTNLEVRMKEINSSNVEVSSTLLERVDLTAEGFPKDTGIFFNTPNYAYKYAKPLNAAYRYRVVLLNTVTKDVDSGETAVLDTARAIFDIPTFTRASFLSAGINFQDEAFTAGRNFTLDNIDLPLGTGYIEGTIRFTWVDRDIASGVLTERAGSWLFAQKTHDPIKKSEDLSVAQTAFYGQLRNIMGAAPNGVERLMDTASITVWISTPEYNTYRNFIDAQGGLTGDQIRPNYTNMMGTDVLGLFTSRAKKELRRIHIEQGSLERLMTNELTKDLKIRGRSPI